MSVDDDRQRGNAIARELLVTRMERCPWRFASQIREELGFTVIELTVVIAIAALLAALAAPTFLSVLASNRLRAAGTDLMSSLLLARSEAIKRNGNVTVAPITANTWSSGWTVVTAGGAQLDRKEDLGNRVAVTKAPATIVYNGSGRLTANTTARVQFADSSSEAGVTPRCVSIDTSGVPKLSAATCP